MPAPCVGEAGGPGQDIYEQILYDVLIHAEWSKSIERKETLKKSKSRVSLTGKIWNATLRKFQYKKTCYICSN